MLRFLRRVQIQQLEQTERWIGQAEKRLGSHGPRRPHTRPPRRRPQPGSRPATAAEWVLEQSIAGPVAVHTGECWIPSDNSRSLSREQARRAVTEGIEACAGCRADAALGLLD